jgi:NAD(P)-dependent dehydrogenase (short-subunit alcohol dehydrogenase family)
MVCIVEKNKNMDEKIMLITGASGGLGTELSRYFHQKKYRLVLLHNNHQPTLPESHHVSHYKVDFRNTTEILSVIKEIIKKWGKIDVLINNAGISQSEISWKVTPEDWHQTLQINLTAPFLISQGVIPTMKDNGFGRIINISSIVAQTGVIGTAAYSASKAGLLGLTKTMSKELAKFNITVNALALGYFNKGMIADVPEKFKQEIIQSIPKGELGSPEIICRTIDFLLSIEANYITGQTINLNGGLYS